MRKVRIASTQFDLPKAVDTDVMTWGSLIPVLLENDINTAGMTATLSPSNVNLERNDAALPEGDIIIFLSPSKVASGDDITSTDENEVSRLSYNVLRSFASKNGIDLSGNPSKVMISKRIAAHNMNLDLEENGEEEPQMENPVTVEEAYEVEKPEVASAERGLRETITKIYNMCKDILSPEEVGEVSVESRNLSPEDEDVMAKFNEFKRS
jgi:hypothetical protein